MKKLGLLLTLLLVTRITNAQTDANKEVFQTYPEQEKFLGSRSMGSDLFYPYAETANGKKTMIRSAARKSSLSRGENVKNENYVENKNIKENFHSAQARRPPTQGRPPRIAMLVIPPAAVIKHARVSVPNRWSIPSIGKF